MLADLACVKWLHVVGVLHVTATGSDVRTTGTPLSRLKISDWDAMRSVSAQCLQAVPMNGIESGMACVFDAKHS